MSEPIYTTLDTNFEQLVKQTQAGQAYWGGTGPAGTTCRECVHWDHEGYKASGLLKDAFCEKFTAIGGRDPTRFSHEALSCKYFERNANPPPVTQQKKVRV